MYIYIYNDDNNNNNSDNNNKHVRSLFKVNVFTAQKLTLTPREKNFQGANDNFFIL